MKPDAPLLHENLTTRFRVERTGPGQDTGERGNVAGHIQFKRGDLEQGFREADVIVEREFSTQTVHQGYIEPHTSTALWAQDGHVTIWTSTQGSFNIRSLTAAILRIPESQIKVIPLEVGGGFGAKGTSYLDPVVTVLSKKSGRPVKITMTRKEVFEGSGPASATYSRCKIGATSSGRITAAQLYLAYEAGAFPGSPVGGGALTGLGPYKVDNLLVDGFDVVVNKQKVQAYRAPGQPQAAFAVECTIDELAEKLGLDRVQGARRGHAGPSPLPHAAGDPRPWHWSRPAPGAGHLGGAPVQQRPDVLSDHPCQQQRHYQPDHRLGGPEWEPGLYCHAGRRGAWPAGRRCQSPGGGHRCERIHSRLRRQPDHLRHRPGGHRGR
jgi:CO/xanthine dehydrogenase Mo-binding subunit